MIQRQCSSRFTAPGLPCASSSTTTRPDLRMSYRMGHAVRTGLHGGGLSPVERRRADCVTPTAAGIIKVPSNTTKGSNCRRGFSTTTLTLHRFNTFSHVVSCGTALLNQCRRVSRNSRSCNPWIPRASIAQRTADTVIRFFPPSGSVRSIGCWPRMIQVIGAVCHPVQAAQPTF